MAVGRRADDLLGRNGAIGTRAVLDDHGLVSSRWRTRDRAPTAQSLGVPTTADEATFQFYEFAGFGRHEQHALDRAAGAARKFWRQIVSCPDRAVYGSTYSLITVQRPSLITDSRDLLEPRCLVGV